MRSEHTELFREHATEGTAPRDAGTADRTPIATPAELWLETAESMFRWYGAMVRFAFGLGRMADRSEAHRMIATSAPVEPDESSAPHSPAAMNGRGEAPSSIAFAAPAALTPAESSPAVTLHSIPTAPVKLGPKRRKTRRKNGARSSRVSSVKRRHRRAA